MNKKIIKKPNKNLKESSPKAIIISEAQLERLIQKLTK
jgi:hypothetical protein